jgi:DNA polymerase III delta prime subunit
MADGSQKQKAGDIDADGSVQIAQAKRDANSIQNSPGATIDNRWSIFGWGSRQPKTIDWSIAAKLMEWQATDVENRLEQMLFGIAAIGLTPTPQEVAKLAATKILTIDETSPEIIDPIRPILEVYDRSSINGSLLILGTPGAGKTTTLLSLAQQLIGRELANLQQRSSKTVIPLIFELSTWRDDQQSIGDWLVAQLYENYGGDRKSRVYETWLEKQVLLPLLDGLDELGLVRQQKCMEQINQFARTYPQLVVCCRVKEYRQVGVKLSNLRGAVQLEPLSDRQIESYLAAVGKSALWEQIQTVPEMQNLLQPVVDPENPDYDEPGLLRVPLFILLAARVFEADRPLKGKADLFDRYIDRQLSFDVRVADRRKEVQKRDWAFKMVEREPDRQLVKHTLIWIAKQLKGQNQVDLLIEKIQPSWVENRSTQFHYQVFYGLLSSLIGGLGGFMFGYMIAELPGGLMFGVIAGVVIGSTGSLEDISPIEHLRISDSKNFFKMLILLLASSASVFTSFSLLVGILNQDLKVRLYPNQGIWKSLQNLFLVNSAISFSITVLLTGVVIIFGNYDFSTALFSLLINYFFIFILILPVSFPIGGGKAIIQHICLRIILTRHYGIPWNLARFLTYCHERRLLQQIGGRYRFIHRELLDHFAGMEN